MLGLGLGLKLRLRFTRCPTTHPLPQRGILIRTCIMHTNKYTHKHLYTQTNARAHAYIHEGKYIHTHLYTWKHLYVCTETNSRDHGHTNIHAHTNSQRAHAYLHIHVCLHTQTSKRQSDLNEITRYFPKQSHPPPQRMRKRAFG